MRTTLQKNPACADAALYYVMYSPVQGISYCSNLLFEICGGNKQGNPEQHWKPTILLRTSFIVHVFYSYCNAYSYWYCFCLWKTSCLNTDTVYDKYVGYNVIISRGRRACVWRRSSISYINPISYVSFACLAQVTHWLLLNAMLQM